MTGPEGSIRGRRMKRRRDCRRARTMTRTRRRKRTSRCMKRRGRDAS